MTIARRFVLNSLVAFACLLHLAAMAQAGV